MTHDEPDSIDVFALSGVVDALYHATNRRIADGLAAAGYPDIRPTHGIVFELIAEGCRLTELADRAGMTKQSMGELVEHLVSNGYLERRPDPADRRARIIGLTTTGRVAARAASNVLLEIYQPWIAATSERTRHRLLNELTRLHATVDAAPDQ